ncbi:hypothetical protein ACVW6Q_003903 [Escherichia coli]|uniref:hypothetical protein n=1 Tax=Escherichia coli TaxID=562 RepID=UPI00201058DF|nr:hypothetical protein [Escherichia coli]
MANTGLAATSLVINNYKCGNTRLLNVAAMIDDHIVDEAYFINGMTAIPDELTNKPRRRKDGRYVRIYQWDVPEIGNPPYIVYETEGKISSLLTEYSNDICIVLP